MGYLRFMRRKQIIPGVRLNISKTGPSVSFGNRGMHYTVGHGRRRTTVGVPGTGLSYTSAHSSPAPSRRRRGSAVAAKSVTAPKKGLTRTVREAPGVGIATGVTMILIGIPLLVLPPVGVGAMAIGLYCIAVAVTVLRGTDHRVDRIVARASRHPETAEQTLRTGLATSPGNPTLLLTMARMYAAQGNYPVAADGYRKLLAVDATNPTAQGECADALLHLGQWKDAIPLLDAVRQHPMLDEESLYSVIAHLAIAYMAIGDNDQAIALAATAPLARRIMSLGLQQCLFMRAAARWFAGQHASAVKDLDRLYAMAPGFAGILEAKAGMADGTFHLDYAGHVVAGAGAPAG